MRCGLHGLTRYSVGGNRTTLEIVDSKFALNDLDAAFRKASERYSPYAVTTRAVPLAPRLTDPETARNKLPGCIVHRVSDKRDFSSALHVVLTADI